MCRYFSAFSKSLGPSARLTLCGYALVRTAVASIAAPLVRIRSSPTFAIADVKTHFNIDPRQVVLGGYSSGGDLSYRIAFTHSTEIAGVLAENTAPFRDTGLTSEAIGGR